MRKIVCIASMVAAAVVGLQSNAWADVLDFTYAGTPGSSISGNLVITTGAVDPAASFFTPSVQITSITGTFDGSAITGLSPIGTFYKTSGIFGSPGNDNILYYPSSQSFMGQPTYVDRYGVSFSTGTDEINLYFGLGGYGELDQTANGTLTSNIGGTLALASPTAVPEPLTLTLFGAGLAGVAAVRRRRKLEEAC